MTVQVFTVEEFHVAGKTFKERRQAEAYDRLLPLVIFLNRSQTILESGLDLALEINERFDEFADIIDRMRAYEFTQEAKGEIKNG